MRKDLRKMNLSEEEATEQKALEAVHTILMD